MRTSYITGGITNNGAEVSISLGSFPGSLPSNSVYGTLSTDVYSAFDCPRQFELNNPPVLPLCVTLIIIDLRNAV